jgi:hypothetical protein
VKNFSHNSSLITGKNTVARALPASPFSTPHCLYGDYRERKEKQTKFVGTQRDFLIARL